MRFFDRKFSLWCLLICLPLLFLPKINLIQVDAKETAGLRIDDLVLFFFGILLMWAHAMSQNRLYPVEGWILAITALGLFSFMTNRLFVSMDILPMDAKIFYPFRLLEYFLFFYIGIMASQYFEARALLKAFLLWNLLLMVLQKTNILGGIASTGYNADVSGRVQGIASFPSEMGLLLNLLFCTFIFDPASQRGFVRFFRSPLSRLAAENFYLWGLFFLFAIFIVFTGNRISIAALIFCFAIRLKQNLRLASFASLTSIVIFITIAALCLGIVIGQTSGVYHRSSELFSWKNLELFSLVWDKIDIAQNPMGNEVVDSKNYDMSWWLRIHKWLFMAKSYITHPECYLQGLGPGYAGAALDGGLLRIVTEYGLIGTFFFWKFFSCLFRLNPQTKWMGAAFALNMIFFDAYLAYKTMSVLLFACGLYYSAGSIALSLKAQRRYENSLCVFAP